jgi:uncharacterized secreted protein with C-terminal beta-propeller domain
LSYTIVKLNLYQISNIREPKERSEPLSLVLIIHLHGSSLKTKHCFLYLNILTTILVLNIACCLRVGIDDGTNNLVLNHFLTYSCPLLIIGWCMLGKM